MVLALIPWYSLNHGNVPWFKPWYYHGTAIVLKYYHGIASFIPWYISESWKCTMILALNYDGTDMRLNNTMVLPHFSTW